MIVVHSFAEFVYYFCGAISELISPTALLDHTSTKGIYSSCRPVCAVLAGAPEAKGMIVITITGMPDCNTWRTFTGCAVHPTPRLALWYVGLRMVSK